MGLKEKRAIKAVEENTFPELKQKITSITGLDLDIEVDWASLIQSEKYDMSNTDVYAEDFDAVFFQPLVIVFEEICQDDMGKDAFKSTINKISIVNTKDNYSVYEWFNLEEGVLTLDYQIISNVDKVEQRAESLGNYLNDKL